MDLTTLKKATKVHASFSRKLVAVCTLSLAAGPVFAQKGFDFGLRGIVQTSSLLNSTDQAAGPELDFKNKVNIGAGVAGGYNFNNHLGVELDVLYSKQGQGYVGDFGKETPPTSGVLILSQEFNAIAAKNTGTYTANIGLTAIKIPILFRYTGDATKKWYFSSFIGPQINLLSSAVIQVNGQTASFGATNIKPEDLYNKTTMDAVLGVGVGINLSKNLVLGVHLRLDYGLSDAENKSETYTLLTTPPISSTPKWYDASRAATHNATGGGMISLNYRIVKKAVTKTVTKTTSTKTTTKSK